MTPPEGPSLLRNASGQRLVPQDPAPEMPRIFCSGSAVGKSLDWVKPVTQASNEESTATAAAWSGPLPPRNVEYTKAEPPRASFETKASPWPRLLACMAIEVTGKSVD